MTVKHLFPAVEPSLNLDFANSKKLDSRITFTRGSTATYTDENGVIQTAAANEARFDHDSDGNSLGLLIEESRTNVLYPSTPDYSGGFGSWSNGSAPLTANAGTAPDGTNTAVLTAWDTVSGAERMYYDCGTPSSVGVTEVHSFFVKAKTPGSGDVFAVTFQGVNWGSGGTKFFDFDTETITAGSTDATVIKYPNGWYRVSFSMTNSGTGVFNTYVAINRNLQTGNWYIWGCQREDGTFPASYIPTTSSTVTRSADVASMTGTNFSSWYNQTEGTISAKCSINADPAGNAYVFSLHGPIASQERIAAYINSSTRAGWVVTTSSVNQAGSNYGDHLAPNGGKFIIGYKLNDFAFDTSLGPIKTDSSGTPSSSINSSSIAALQSGSSLLNGHISRLTYYPYRLTDAQLQALTL